MPSQTCIVLSLVHRGDSLREALENVTRDGQMDRLVVEKAEVQEGLTHRAPGIDEGRIIAQCLLNLHPAQLPRHANVDQKRPRTALMLPSRRYPHMEPLLRALR